MSHFIKIQNLRSTRCIHTIFYRHLDSIPSPGVQEGKTRRQEGVGRESGRGGGRATEGVGREGEGEISKERV